MEFLNHLNRRIKSDVEIKLPMTKLLDHLSSSERSILTTVGQNDSLLD